MTYICFLACSCWLWILGGLPASQRHQIYGASIVLGLGCSTLLVTSLAMTAELVGDNTVCPLVFKQALPFKFWFIDLICKFISSFIIPWIPAPIVSFAVFCNHVFVMFLFLCSLLLPLTYINYSLFLLPYFRKACCRVITITHSLLPNSIDFACKVLVLSSFFRALVPLSMEQ